MGLTHSKGPSRAKQVKKYIPKPPGTATSISAGRGTCVSAHGSVQLKTCRTTGKAQNVLGLGPPGLPIPHFYRQGPGPARPPKPSLLSTGPGPAWPPNPSLLSTGIPHFYREGLGLPGPPTPHFYWPDPSLLLARPLTSMSQVRPHHVGPCWHRAGPCRASLGRVAMSA